MYSAVIAFLFRVINFAVLLGLVVRWFKKNAQASIESQISEDEAYRSGLQQRVGTLESRVAELSEERDMLRIQCEQLHLRIGQWTERLESLHKQQRAEHNRIEHTMGKKREHQQHMLAHAQLQQTAFPRALKTAATTLTAQYASAAAQQQYIAQLLGETRG